jgi:hypothetical protein
MKTTPVSIYVDDVLVGSGELAYNDVSSPALTPLTVRHCDETPAHVDDITVPLLLCWDDTVALGFGGAVERELNIPVYVGDVEVGSATVKLSDSHSADLTTVLISVAMISLLAGLIIRLVIRIKRGESK